MNLARMFPRRASATRRRIVPIRLLKVVPTSCSGGTENQFMTLGRALDPQRFGLELACLRRWGSLSTRSVARHSAPRIRHLDVLQLARLGQQARFARHIVPRRIDVVHAYSFYGNVFAILPARVAGAPVVIASIRDRGAYLTPMQKRVQRLVCRLADCVLVNADAVKDWLVGQRLRPGEDRRHSQRRRPRALRRQPATRIGSCPSSALPTDAPMVAVVSRLKRLKGLEQFLEAAVL